MKFSFQAEPEFSVDLVTTWISKIMKLYEHVTAAQVLTLFTVNSFLPWVSS